MIVVTRGVPASGKSTWASAWVAESPDTRARVNRDDYRAMMFDVEGIGTNAQERAVSVAVKSAVRDLVGAGLDVVVDATNLKASYAREWYSYGVPVRFEDFPIALNDAVTNDLKRAAQGQRSVGREVIESFYKRFGVNKLTGKLPEYPRNTGAIYEPVFEPYEYVMGLPHAVIVDIDGTLAHMTNRGPYDTSKYADDEIDPVIRGLVNSLYRSGKNIIVVSGRDAEFRTVLVDWLDKHEVFWDRMYMRPEGDRRNDSIVKNELYEQYIKGQYNIDFVLDDRDRVVAMWRAKGIKCLQVQPGSF